MKKKLFRWFKIIVLVYGIVGVAIYSLQDYFLFHPEKIAPGKPYGFTQVHKEINIPFNATSNLHFVKFLANDSVIKKGVVLYFHGNKKNIGWYAKYAPNFTKKGYEVWMMDYPGFGKSTGPFTEQQLYVYAMEIYKLARAAYNKDSIIIYGKSMGTGIAAYLAAARDCKALLLETPYYSMHKLAATYLPVYPVKKIIKYRFPTFEYLQKVTAPITIFHGTGDWVTPYRQAKQLQPFLKPGDGFITVTGASHNDLNDFPLFHQKLDSVLSQ